ncbi:MAG: ABC transporter ATP-binding protein [Rhizobiales bacterium]|nr:ABC transporter ATP-binding protein [Hyphomicrobiales bacterium]
MTDFPPPVLQISNICKSYGALQVSDNVSLQVYPNTIHALIGPNGAGKSTLIGQISGFIKPDSGEIRISGRIANHFSPERRVQLGLGRSFQTTNLMLEWSVRRNVMLAVRRYRGSSFRYFTNIWNNIELHRSAEVALRRVGLDHAADIEVSALSHGQRRLVELACAIALEPRVLVLDEPMAGLGPDGLIAMTQLLKKTKPHIPILLVEHDMDAVFELADYITVLDYGRIIAKGTVEQIKNSPLVQKAYLGAAPDAA